MPGGGRTINERPLRKKECFLEYVGDIDISGAYASQLRKIFYPQKPSFLGRPRSICFTSNQESSMTLGDFMAKYSHIKAWFKKYKLLKVIVSGDLNFCQDLIFSRLISTSAVEKKLKNYNKLKTNQITVLSQFVLLRKQIINGLITYDLWDFIDKISSNSEKNTFKNLKVQTALFYFDDDCYEEIEDYLNELLKDCGTYSFSFKEQSVRDTRTHKTFIIPLNNFIDPLIKIFKIFEARISTES